MSRQDANAAFALSSFLQGTNATYIDEIYARYENDPSSVDSEWQEFFKSLKDTPSDVRKNAEGLAEEPNEMELNTIRNDPQKLATIRLRLSDIAWWMRLLCQHIAVRANHEDGEVGKFFQSRYRAVRLLDEAAILACAAYVDLNPIRAAMAETLEADFQRQILAAFAAEAEERLQAITDHLLALEKKPAAGAVSFGFYMMPDS